jgi:hypothetical protein
MHLLDQSLALNLGASGRGIFVVVAAEHDALVAVHRSEGRDLFDECAVEPVVLDEKDVSDVSGVLECRPCRRLGPRPQSLQPSGAVERRAEALADRSGTVTKRPGRGISCEIRMSEVALLAYRHPPIVGQHLAV